MASGWVDLGLFQAFLDGVQQLSGPSPVIRGMIDSQDKPTYRFCYKLAVADPGTITDGTQSNDSRCAEQTGNEPIHTWQRADLKGLNRLSSSGDAVHP